MEVKLKYCILPITVPDTQESCHACKVLQGSCHLICYCKGSFHFDLVNLFQWGNSVKPLLRQSTSLKPCTTLQIESELSDLKADNWYLAVHRDYLITLLSKQEHWHDFGIKLAHVVSQGFPRFWAMLWEAKLEMEWESQVWLARSPMPAAQCLMLTKSKCVKISTGSIWKYGFGENRTRGLMFHPK